MNDTEIIEYINNTDFITLDSVRRFLEKQFNIKPYYENYINERHYGDVIIGMDIYKIDDKFIYVEGLTYNYANWHEDTVGYVKSGKYNI